VMPNLLEAQHDSRWAAHGRYGFSNVNMDRNWVGRDVVGIDLGAAVLALDNYLHHDRVRRVFQDMPCVCLGLERLGFTRVAAAPEKACPSRQPEPIRRAS
jgi:hypothetical protein